MCEKLPERDMPVRADQIGPEESSGQEHKRQTKAIGRLKDESDAARLCAVGLTIR
jgi:hypothetical protein